MINIADLKDNIELYKKKLELKGYTGNLDKLNNIINSKNLLQTELDELRNNKNSISICTKSHSVWVYYSLTI